LMFGDAAVSFADAGGCCGGFWWANQWQNSASTLWRWVLSPSSDKTHHSAEDWSKTHRSGEDGDKTHRSGEDGDKSHRSGEDVQRDLA
ncbi:MAG: hypothetical protein FWD55_07570, partial [Propionibacteriaceae bacterium]|nr:hypothetical protein [Propionibacteriaceae bacterium]